MKPLLLPNLVSAEQCHTIMLRAEARGFAPATVRTSQGPRMLQGIRNNDRVDFEDSELSAMLWSRVLPHLDGEPHGLDPHLRVYRYDVGQRFMRHRDGSVTVGGRESELSFLVYLNDDFEGGQTRFAAETIAPDLGAGLIFPHALKHEGTAVTRGRKYVLRTDILF